MEFPESYKSLLRILNDVPRFNIAEIEALSNVARTFKDAQRIIDPFGNAAKRIADISSVHSQINSVFNDQITSSLKLAQEATRNIFHAMDGPSISQMIREANIVSNDWARQISIFGYDTNQSLTAQIALQSQFADISRISVGAEQAIANVSAASFGARLSDLATVRDAFRLNVDGISDSFRALSQSISQPQFNPLQFHPSVTLLPPVEYFNHARIAQVFSIGDELTAVEEEPDWLNTNETDSVTRLLANIDPDFIPMWQGAQTALKTNNPDRIRHFAISARELFTHILHRLAPDNEVVQWSTSPLNFDKNGRPTRKARLLYICRNVSHPPLHRFFSKDIEAMLEIMDLFQSGTHGIKGPFSDSQLHVITVRAESSLKFILEIYLKACGT